MNAIKALWRLCLAGLATLAGCSNMMDYYSGDWGPGRYRPDSVIINNGDRFAYALPANLRLYSGDAVSMRLSVDGSGWSEWEPYAPSRDWTLDYGRGHGETAVYVEFENHLGEVRPAQDDIFFIDRVIASDGLGGAQYGCAVSMDAGGFRIAVGARARNVIDAYRHDGAVYACHWNGIAWDERPVGRAESEGRGGDFGTSVALSGDGNTLAVGAPLYRSSNVTDSGRAFTYRWNGSAWALSGEHAQPDIMNHTRFGMSIALSHDGSRLIAGGYPESGAGQVHVFDHTGMTWTGGQPLQFPGPPQDAVDAFYGYSVSLSGDGSVAAVGASQQNNSAGACNQQGYVHLFSYTGSWQATASLTTPMGSPYALFGSSVSLSPDGLFLAVGARGYMADGRIGQGAVFIYEYSGGTWTLAKALTIEDGRAGDHFGSSVALSGAGGGGWTLVAGSADRDINFANQGALYVFEQNRGGPGAWGLRETVVAADGAAGDQLGSSLAISGDGSRCVTGAPNDRVDGLYQGSAYIFTID